MKRSTEAGSFMLARHASAAFRGPTFAAIDFETADYDRDSACAVAIVRVENYVIVDRVHHFIRPPRKAFVFTYLHGISWSDVAGEPTFRQLWPSLRSALNGVDFVAAHNASFDRSVLKACCERARLNPPNWTFHCTVRLARAVWDVYPTKLPDVCRRLRIPLRHHDAVSDAEACAKIVIAAAETGATLLPAARPSRSARIWEGAAP